MIVLDSSGVVSNLPGWRWARIKQLALVGSSSSWHSEVCNALRGSFRVVYSEISDNGDYASARAPTVLSGFAKVLHLEVFYEKRSLCNLIASKLAGVLPLWRRLCSNRITLKWYCRFARDSFDKLQNRDEDKLCVAAWNVALCKVSCSSVDDFLHKRCLALV